MAPKRIEFVRALEWPNEGEIILCTPSWLREDIAELERRGMLEGADIISIDGRIYNTAGSYVAEIDGIPVEYYFYQRAQAKGGRLGTSTRYSSLF